MVVRQEEADEVYSPDRRVDAILRRLEKERESGMYDEEMREAKSLQITLRWEPQCPVRVYDDASGETRVVMEKESRPPRYATQVIAVPIVSGGGSAALWQNDVKQSLGISHTLLDQWLTPVKLTLNRSESQATLERLRMEFQMMNQPFEEPTVVLPFAPSAQHEGLRVIDARLLYPNCVYDVEFRDTRLEALRGLSQRDVEDMQASFDRMDKDRSGTISKAELEDEIKHREESYRRVAKAQFHRFVAENPGNAAWAEKVVELHEQKIRETSEKLREMFAKADIDGDGTMTRSEYQLAEAWWLRSAMNPSKVSLFGSVD